MGQVAARSWIVRPEHTLALKKTLDGRLELLPDMAAVNPGRPLSGWHVLDVPW